MTKATIKYVDDKKRRIILLKEIAEIEDLHNGDFIEIDALSGNSCRENNGTIRRV